MKLSEIVTGCKIKGLAAGHTVEIRAVKWYGENVLEIDYRDDQGQSYNQMLYEEDAADLELETAALPWSFDANADDVRLVSEACRIELAYLFDPYLAVHTSSIDPLPHQISAVYEKMLERQPLRFVLADDPGAGKTIMTGLLIKELIIRGDLRRCLIVCPGNLAEQWQDELWRKFHLRFEILTNDRLESAVTGNIFLEMNYCIARLDKLSRSEEIQAKLKVTDWDLIVCDEAHKMSATLWGNEVKYTKRFMLGKLLGTLTRHFLLLTATPHNGKEGDFALFMSLIDPDRFEGAPRTSHQAIDVSDVMRRLVKEELLKFDGKPLFPERRAYTVNYDLSLQEARLYSEVTEYVNDGFNRAENLNKDRKATVGFALTILQRRLASSPEAIYQSLARRTKRLQQLLQEEKLKKRASSYVFPDLEDMDDFDDAPSEEIETAEEEIVDQATASQTIAEIEEEIRTLKRLTKMAGDVRASGEDRKWDELSKLLQENKNIVSANNTREKLIIFTEHKDTLYYLQQKIASLLGRSEAVVTIHGGMVRDERRKVEERFKQDKDVLILVATDAAGEGINLQRAHLMINYDLPWNPNRLEQRFGRIHRIGQTEVCHLWNLVAKGTREGAVFQRLFEKLEEERKALGGKVFDILGKLSFDNKPLRELLIEAIRYGNDPLRRKYLNTVMDTSFDPAALKKLLENRALTNDVMNAGIVSTIREDMERIEARKLQPHFVESFFIAAFRRLSGRIHRREPGRYEISRVPSDIRRRDSIIGFGEPVLTQYERICFRKEDMNLPGLVPAEFICPGHPLLESVIDIIRERYGSVLKQGTIFIDDRDDSSEIRLLFAIENRVQDGQTIHGTAQRRVISRQIHFVELCGDGSARAAGYAPYLDYRAPSPTERDKVLTAIQSERWLKGDVGDLALRYAIQHILPRHRDEVTRRKKLLLDKTEQAVRDRLTSEIRYWDYRAGELRTKEAAGKRNDRLNADKAAKRAEELTARLRKRMDEITAERKITSAPPLVVSGALVVPRGWLQPETTAPGRPDAAGRTEIERIAMDAVMAIERTLGYEPRDVSAAKCGYDVESAIPPEKRQGESCLRFIEVKGRRADADTVTVSTNEIITGLNAPDDFILAIVQADGEKWTATYLKHPFEKAPDFAATSVTYKIRDLMQQGEQVLLRTKDNSLCK